METNESILGKYGFSSAGARRQGAWPPNRRLEELFCVAQKVVHAGRQGAPLRDEPEHGGRRLPADSKIAHARRTQLTHRLWYEGHPDAGRDQTDDGGHLWRFLADPGAEPGILAGRNDGVIEQAAVRSGVEDE